MAAENAFYSSLIDRMRGFLYRQSGARDGFKMLLVTGGVERFTGYPASAFLPGGGVSFSDVNIDHERIVAQVVGEKHFENRTTWDVQYRIRHRDGRIFAMHEVGAAVYDALGEIIYLEGAIVDAGLIQSAIDRSNSRRASLNEIMEQSSAILAVLSQLTMLAFNARIESQRAGDEGLGFTVIATEMKSIAQQAQSLVQMIEAERNAIATELAA
jgi:hypothetical protein